MKKIFSSILLLSLVGLTACGKQAEVSKFPEQEAYLKSRYNKEFSIESEKENVEYTIYDKENYTKATGSLNVYSCTSNSDRRFYVYALVEEPAVYYDNYTETQVSLLLETELEDYIRNIDAEDITYQCYTEFNNDSVEYSEIKTVEDYKGLSYKNIELSICIPVPEGESASDVFDKNLSTLYDVYNYLMEYSGDNATLNVGFTNGDEELKKLTTEKYTFDDNSYVLNNSDGILGSVFVSNETLDLGSFRGYFSDASDFGSSPN